MLRFNNEISGEGLDFRVSLKWPLKERLGLVLPWQPLKYIYFYEEMIADMQKDESASQDLFESIT